MVSQSPINNVFVMYLYSYLCDALFLNSTSRYSMLFSISGSDFSNLMNARTRIVFGVKRHDTSFIFIISQHNCTNAIWEIWTCISFDGCASWCLLFVFYKFPCYYIQIKNVFRQLLLLFRKITWKSNNNRNQKHLFHSH